MSLGWVRHHGLMIRRLRAAFLRWGRRVHGNVIGDPPVEKDGIGPEIGWDGFVVSPEVGVAAAVGGWIAKLRRKGRRAPGSEDG